MTKHKTIAEEAIEKLEKNPPTWQDMFAVNERHIERIERENARLQRKVGRLEAENEWLKGQLKEGKRGR